MSMKLEALYRSAVEIGIGRDPRGKAVVRADLVRAGKDYEKLDEKEKETFDREMLVNPYADTRILNGAAGVDVRRVLLGIDVEVGELLVADRLKERGERIDAVIAHHPEGRALAGMAEVMHMQADILEGVGVPITAAESLLEGRIREVGRRVLPLNHMRSVDAARLLGLPFMCVHTPADNCVADHLQRLFDRKKPRTLKDIIDGLKEIPEYCVASGQGLGPKIIVGSGSKRAGRVFVDMTGGTGGPETIFRNLSHAGVGTVVGMHFQEKNVQEAEKNHVNLVVAGHIASDTLGLNILLDELVKKGKLDVVACSGFARFQRGRKRGR